MNFIGTVSDYQKAFAENLSRLRLSRGLTPERLAALAGFYDRSTIHHLENQKKKPSFQTLVRLSDVLNCQPSDLLKVTKLTGGKNGLEKLGQSTEQAKDTSKDEAARTNLCRSSDEETGAGRFA